MKHKDFTGTINYSKVDKVYFGKITSISDLVTYESKSTSGLLNEFRSAVEDYILTLNAIKK